MSFRKNYFVIADPSLTDIRGHHFTLSKQITFGAQSLGMDVIWLTNKDFSLSEYIENVIIYPVFSSTMYDRYNLEKKNDLPLNLYEYILNELDEGIKNFTLTENDHVFFHTGYGDVFQAVFDFFKRSSWVDKPFLHICTPYDLQTMPGKDSLQSIENIFRDMKGIEAIDKKLFLWAETPQLASNYNLNYDLTVRALPLPPPYDMNLGKEKNDVITALYLGAAREEKGFLLLPDLIERLYDDYGRTGKLRFVIQCTPQIIGYLPEIKQAINRLSKHPNSYVKLIDKTLDKLAYYDELINSDVVLLLYNKKNYKIRGSGIAVEAICAEKCILTHRGTFCASLITHDAGGVVDDIDGAVASLSKLVDEQEKYKIFAKIQGMQYRRVNSVERYVTKIVNQTKPDFERLFSPKSIIGDAFPLLINF